MLAYDVDFNREVVGAAGRYFGDAVAVGSLVEAAENDPATVLLDGKRARERAEAYDWDDVAAGYERLAQQLAARQFPAVRPSGHRHPPAPLPAVQPGPVVP